MNMISELALDLRKIGWRSAGLLAFFIVAVYGMLFMNPVTAYDFSAAKGDALQVFLTYFFMRRIAQGMIAGTFHDFSPLWNWAVGLFFLWLFANLLLVLARRLKLSSWPSHAFVLLWLAAPFFFNRSVYQHAMPAEPIAFCLDALVLLLFERIRSSATQAKAAFMAASVCAFVSISVYQAHANLLLTALLGVCCLSPRRTWRGWFRDMVCVAAILTFGVCLWASVNYGPIVIAKLFGITFPKSGGSHDTVYWFALKMPFARRCAGLFVGLLLNWGYNAFFVAGLRCVLLAALLCGVLVAGGILAAKRKEAVYVVSFALSIFAMPVVQCSAANLRIYYCLSAFIAFSGALLMQCAAGRKGVHQLCSVAVVVAILSLAHETSTLYYYQWKLKSHDALHMGNVANDIWRRFGLAPDKPVAVIGGWKHYPSCWEDMRPNRDLPLLDYPFSSYSNMTDINVPREFYMVAREKVGLVVIMPDAEAYRKAKTLTSAMPAYPQEGYIAERDGLIVVNLGERMERWKRFDFAQYRSPNERLLSKAILEDKWLALKRRIAQPFINLSVQYPWVLSQEDRPPPPGLHCGRAVQNRPAVRGLGVHRIPLSRQDADRERDHADGRDRCEVTRDE